MSGKLSQVQGLILSKTLYKEKDLIIKILDPDEGIITAYVKNAFGSKKRYVAVTDIFILIRGFYRAKSDESMVNLKDIEVIEQFNTIRSDYSKYLWACLSSEIALSMSKGSENAAICFRFLYKMFRFQKSMDARLWQVQIHKWLAYLGFLPDTGTCINCGNQKVKYPVYPSPSLEHIRCDLCGGEKVNIAESQMNFFQLLREMMSELQEKKLHSIDPLISHLIDQNLEQT